MGTYKRGARGRRRDDPGLGEVEMSCCRILVLIFWLWFMLGNGWAWKSIGLMMLWVMMDYDRYGTVAMD